MRGGEIVATGRPEEVARVAGVAHRRVAAHRAARLERALGREARGAWRNAAHRAPARKRRAGVVESRLTSPRAAAKFSGCLYRTIPQ